MDREPSLALSLLLVVAGAATLFSLGYQLGQKSSLVSNASRSESTREEDEEDYSNPPSRPLDYEAWARGERWRKTTVGGKKRVNALAKWYYGYGSQNETNQKSREFLLRLSLLPRAMSGPPTPLPHDHLDRPRTTIFGATCSIPVIVAPTALHNYAHELGEAGMAMGAGNANVLYCYNYFLASQPVEKIAAIPGPKWLHLYLFVERELIEFALKDALENHPGVFSGIIVTCDHPHNRVRDTVVQGFHALYEEHLPPNSRASLYFPNLGRAAQWSHHPTTEEMFQNPKMGDALPSGTNDSNLTWEDFKWLKTLVGGRLPLVAKGILHPRDAVLACEAGADGIVVSNHGGRQFDGGVPAIQILPEILREVKRAGYPHVEVFVDSGVRSSQDVLKCLALGAKGVLMGRPPLWALAYGGPSEVERMFRTMTMDLECDMRCLGWLSTAAVPTDALHDATRARE